MGREEGPRTDSGAGWLLEEGGTDGPESEVTTFPGIMDGNGRLKNRKLLLSLQIRSFLGSCLADLVC